MFFLNAKFIAGDERPLGGCMEPAFKTLRASIPRQPLSPQITGAFINKLQQLFQKSSSWLHLATVPGGKAASWETSGWPYWDKFKHSGASIPRQPLSPQITDELINELAEQCQKSRFWPPPLDVRSRVWEQKTILLYAKDSLQTLHPPSHQAPPSQRYALCKVAWPHCPAQPYTFHQSLPSFVWSSLMTSRSYK